MAEDPECTPKQDMSLLCRVCANQHDYLIPIFQGEGLDHEMPTKMNKHLPIKVRESDKLPTQMCYQCASTIIAWSELHTNCVAADKKLKGMLKINEKKARDAARADDAGSDHYEDAYDDVGGGGDDDDDDNDDDDNDDEDFEKEIKQLISDAGVELDSKSERTSKRPSRAAATRKRKAEITITPVKREPKKPKTEPKSSSGLLKPKEEVLSNDDRYLTCFQCQIDFTTKAELLIHCNSVHPPEHFVCDICKMTFLMKSQLRIHIKEHFHVKKKKRERVQKFRICQFCPATFPFSRGSRQVFNDHMKSVHNEFVGRTERAPTFHLCTCHICGKIFRHKGLLKSHILVHNEEESFVCDEENCTAKFTQKRYLTRHKKYIHEKNPYPVRVNYEKMEHPCTTCGKTFSNIKSMFAHSAYCGAYLEDTSKETAQKIKRKRTRTGMSTGPRTKTRTSTVVHTVFCDFCGKGFKTTERLLKHMYYHSKEYKEKISEYMKNKPRKVCPICGIFTKTLGQHVLLHTAKYTCSVCNKVVNRKDALEIHMRVHTGERPFVCFLCGNSYKQRPDMDRHQRRVHNFEPVASKRAMNENNTPVT